MLLRVVIGSTYAEAEVGTCSQLVSPEYIDLGIGYGPNDVRTGTVVWTAITSHVRLVDGLSWE